LEALILRAGEACYSEKEMVGATGFESALPFQLFSSQFTNGPSLLTKLHLLISGLMNQNEGLRKSNVSKCQHSGEICRVPIFATSA
jgi:hypothetical protein